MTAAAAASNPVATATRPFIAKFKAARGQLPLGTMSFRLRRASKSGCFIYTDAAYPNAFAKLFVGNIRETSRFCIRNGQVQPQSFSHHIDGKPGDSYTLNYNWSNHTIAYKSEDGKHKSLSFKHQALDALTLQIAARLWIARSNNPGKLGTRTFTYVDEDRIKPYKLGVRTDKTVQVPAGRYHVIRVGRVGNDDHLRFWLARGADFIPVQVEHQKKQGAIIRLEMTQLSLGQG